MRHMTTILLIISAVLSMGAQPKVYVDQFHNHFRMKPKEQVRVNILEDHYFTGDTIGKCMPSELFDTKTSWVVIKESWWEEASEGHRWSLVFHELGHCVYRLQHPDGPTMTTIEDGKEHQCPWSVMHHRMASEACFDDPKDRRWYIRELKDKVEEKYGWLEVKPSSVQ